MHAVTLTRGGPYEAMIRDAGVRLTHLNKRMKFDPLALWRLRSLVEAEQPDILHSWIFAANSYGRLVAGKTPRPEGARLGAVRRFLEEPLATLARPPPNRPHDAARSATRKAWPISIAIWACRPTSWP